MDIFLVESPLQYLNAEEASFKFNTNKESILLIFQGASEESLRQMKNVIRQDLWGRIYFLKGTNRRRTFYKSQKELNKILDSYSSIAIRNVFIGEYRSMLMRHFVNSSSCKESYLLDDGNASLIVHQRIRNKQGYHKDVKWYRKPLNYLNKLNHEDILDIKFFTVYTKYSRSFDVINNYDLLKSRINKNLGKDNSVWILGNNVSELNFVNRAFYLDQIRSIAMHFENKEIYYLPHRREDSRRFQEIEGQGVKIRTSKYPVEMEILNSNSIPYALASFCTSALDNCYHIFGNVINIYAFRYNIDGIKSTVYKNEYEIAYKEYETYDRDKFLIIDI